MTLYNTLYKCGMHNFNELESLANNAKIKS